MIVAFIQISNPEPGGRLVSARLVLLLLAFRQRASIQFLGILSNRESMTHHTNRKRSKDRR